MNMSASLLRGGLFSTHATNFVMGTLYKQLVEKDISSFEEFYSAVLDVLDTFISELPIETYHIPSKKAVEGFFNDWKRAPQSERKELLIGFIKKSLNLSKLSDSTLVIGIVTATAAAKIAGKNVPQLKIINGIGNPIFVPALTLFPLVFVKLTRNLLTLWHGDAISANGLEKAEEESVSEDQAPEGKGKLVKYAAEKDQPQGSSCQLQKQAGKDQPQELIGIPIGQQGRSRSPSKKIISRSESARLSVNPRAKLSSSEQQTALVDEMLSLFSKFELELSLSGLNIQAAVQNVKNALKTGPYILQDPEQVKKLKRALRVICTCGSDQDTFSAGQMAVITSFDQDIDKLEQKFRIAEDVATKALQLQANKEQAEKDFQEAYHLLKELKARDGQIKDQMGKLKSEMDSIRAAEKENLRKINNCFESGKFHKELATKCEMDLRHLGHARDKAKKDKSDVEAAIKYYRQQLA